MCTGEGAFRRTDWKVLMIRTKKKDQALSSRPSIKVILFIPLSPYVRVVTVEEAWSPQERKLSTFFSPCGTPRLRLLAVC